jgi:hypothetical protein
MKNVDKNTQEKTAYVFWIVSKRGQVLQNTNIFLAQKYFRRPNNLELFDKSADVQLMAG